MKATESGPSDETGLQPEGEESFGELVFYSKRIFGYAENENPGPIFSNESFKYHYMQRDGNLYIEMSGGGGVEDGFSDWSVVSEMDLREEGPLPVPYGIGSFYSYGPDGSDVLHTYRNHSIVVSSVTGDFPYVFSFYVKEYKLSETVEDPGGEEYGEMEYTGDEKLCIVPLTIGEIDFNDASHTYSYGTSQSGSRLFSVDIEVPDATQDGVPSGKFKITGLPSGVTIDSYEWKWHTDHHPSAAHPEMSELPDAEFFDDKTIAEPIVPKPRWFATTGNKYQESLGRAALASCSHIGAPFRADYKISCILTIGGASIETPKVDWEVFVFDEEQYPDGPYVSRPSLNDKRPKVETRYIEATDEYEAYVSNRNGFSRIPPVPDLAGMVVENQFYTKIIDIHEQEHYKQWNEQSPWKDLYDADGLWTQIEGMTLTGDRTVIVPDLNQMIETLINDHIQDSDTISEVSSDCRERKAHTLSNEVDPDFLEIDLGCGYPSSNYSCN